MEELHEMWVEFNKQMIIELGDAIYQQVYFISYYNDGHLNNVSRIHTK